MRTSLLMFSLFFLLAGIAHAVSQPRPDNLKTVGEASLRVLWFNIYDARLASASGRYSETDPALWLELIYQRDFSREELLSETRKQWARQGLSATQYQPWLAQLQQIWPDIRQQDSLAFYQDDVAHGHFYFNDRYIGSVTDAGFSQAFLAIWLAEDSAFPGVSRALRGE